ncbi:MAG: protein kinase [Myxococcales bacterium]|nr:protein kinase [Myxococcales bacterium]
MTAIDSALRQARNQNNSPLHALTHSSEATHSGARVGQLLCGRYRLELLLGKGAMGEVYRATDTERQEPCAIKLVLPEASLPLQAQRRLVQEAKVISRLYHPNIVEVREFLQDRDGTCLLVMELLQGVDLQTVLHKQGRLPLWRALEIARSVGAALQYAHEMGVIHRDISPGNIFLAQQGLKSQRTRDVIKVLDFGLAKLIEDCQASADAAGAPITKGIIVGTPAYLPPEAAQWSPARRDPRSDQWSLGVVLYHMLAGQLPFPQKNPYELYSAICYEEPIPLSELAPNLPAHIYATVQTALAKSCEQRFPSVKDFLRALDALPPLRATMNALSNHRDTLAQTPSVAEIERSRRHTPPKLHSLAEDEERETAQRSEPSRPPQSTINSAPYSPLSTVQYSLAELQALASASRSEPVPEPVQEEQITARYLNPQHLVEDTSSEPPPPPQPVSHGATVSLTAEEAASLGLPGLTRKPPRPPQLPPPTEQQPAGADSRETAPPSRSEPSVSRSKPEAAPSSVQVASQDPVPAMVAPALSIAPGNGLAWLRHDSNHSLRQGLVMMGLGVVLSLLTGWALGLFGSQRSSSGRTVAQVNLPKDTRTAMEQGVSMPSSLYAQQPVPTAQPLNLPSPAQPTPTSAKSGLAPTPSPQVGRPTPARSASSLKQAPIPPLRAAQ